MVKSFSESIKSLFLYPKLFLGLIIFKLKYPSVKWVRPIKFGTYFSQGGQDLFLSVLLFSIIERNPSENYWVVDIGCNDPIYFNNSIFFEKYFNCRVLAIDPIVEFDELWKASRKSAIFESCATGNENGFIDLNLPNSKFGDNMFSFIDKGSGKASSENFTKRQVKLSRLDDILTKHIINNILLLSIDVEGSELQTLQGINFDETFIYCILVENNSDSFYGSENIRKFLLGKDFSFYARIGHLDDVFINNKLVRG